MLFKNGHKISKLNGFCILLSLAVTLAIQLYRGIGIPPTPLSSLCPCEAVLGEI
jgi:hypothetical protein